MNKVVRSIINNAHMINTVGLEVCGCTWKGFFNADKTDAVYAMGLMPIWDESGLIGVYEEDTEYDEEHHMTVPCGMAWSYMFSKTEKMILRRAGIGCNI